MLAVELGGAELAHHQDRTGRAAGCPERGDRAWSDRGHAGPQHDQDAEEADRDRGPAAPADALTQHRHRERRDQERRGEDDRIGIGQRQQAVGVEGEKAAAHAAEAPQNVQAQAPRAQPLDAAPPQSGDGDRNQREQSVEKDQLMDRVASAQPFDQRVHDGEQRESQSAEAEAGADQGRCRCCRRSNPELARRYRRH